MGGTCGAPVGRSFGGAVGVAERLPAQEAARLLEVAFKAFPEAVQSGCVFGAVLLVPTAIRATCYGSTLYVISVAPSRKAL